MRAAPQLPTDRLTVIAWPDEMIDTLGHDARGRYVEKYWLSVLGPSTTCLLRLLVDELEANPAGVTVDLAATARRIGVRMKGGRTCPFMRAVGRLIQFEVAQLHGPGVLAVRRRLPTLSRRQLIRLPEDIQQQHNDWLEAQLRNAS